ncbi:transmembrane protein [Anaeramoeba flamelloides]|uniref:Transmembrane protein n=1 Tax=Anaeramoeba flamelloides TaxID=1746091 RepID=A0AAV7Y9S4_9EUKA|nr:transmembrane protein [Anaeramoeba flamelloides]
MVFSRKVGWLAVFGGIIGFGLFGVPMKHKKVLKANMHSVIYSFYLSFMVFLVPFFLLFKEPFVVSIYGVLAGFIWVPSCFGSVLVVQSIGLTVGISMWSVLVMFVSFCWGQIYGHEMKNTALTIVGLVLLFGGILLLIKVPRNEGGASKSEEKIRSREEEKINFAKSKHQDQELSLSSSGNLSEENLIPKVESMVNVEDSKMGQADPKGVKKVSNFMGWIGVLLVGICGGSSYAPLKLAKPEYQGLMVPMSFGIGSFSAITLITIIFCIKKKLEGQKVLELFHFKICYFALSSGLIWCFGNICSIVTILSPLGLSIGYPLTQLAVLVSSLSGIILFKEITGKNIIYFAFCFVFAIGGGALLGIYG